MEFWGATGDVGQASDLILGALRVSRSILLFVDDPLGLGEEVGDLRWFLARQCCAVFAGVAGANDRKHRVGDVTTARWARNRLGLRPLCGRRHIRLGSLDLLGPGPVILVASLLVREPDGQEDRHGNNKYQN